MARTEHDPISIAVTIKGGAVVVWTPGPHGQKHLHKVPEEELPEVIDLLETSLKNHMKGVNGAICDAVGHKAKKHAAALVALESSESLATGGLSDKDHPDLPFGFPVHN